MHLHKRFGALAILAMSVLVFAGVAAAATVIVTQNSSGWFEETAAGGDVEFTEAYNAPPGLGDGAVELTTTSDTASRAGLFTNAHAGTPLATVTTLGYWTYQAQGNTAPVADPSYQLQIDANGLATAGGFTTLVFEPYGNVIRPDRPGDWQHWDVDAGLFWSSRSVPECGCRRRRRPAAVHALDREGDVPECRRRRIRRQHRHVQPELHGRFRPDRVQRHDRTTSRSAAGRARRTIARTAAG